jgi:hypothetical protein
LDTWIIQSFKWFCSWLTVNRLRSLTHIKPA